MGTCLDQDQNVIDCNNPDCTYGDCTDQSSSTGSLLSQVQSAQMGTPSGSQSPIAVSSGASGSGGAGFFSSFLNFGTSVVKAIAPTSQNTGLQLRVNPATGQSQYYNPSSGQYVAGPVNSGGIGSMFGSSSWLLVVVAMVVAFLAFGGRKRLLS